MNLLPAIEMGALAAKRRAKRRDAAATSVCATSLTRPRRSASAAVMRSPEKRTKLGIGEANLAQKQLALEPAVDNAEVVPPG